MFGSDCKRIYGSKDYHRKRLKVLEKNKYIRRVNRICIKLDVEGTKLVKQFGYDYSFLCRKKVYVERLHEVAKIAALTINSTMEFVASWDIKDKSIYTETSRKYIGELKYIGKKYITYYISKNREQIYIGQIKNDIYKLSENKNVIIFMEDLEFLNSNGRFVFGNESTMIIDPTKKNLDIMRFLEEIDIYMIIKQIYTESEILLSNWKKANYMTEDRTYIVVMPFIDTERIKGLEHFFRNNQNTNRKVELITLKENIEIIEVVLKDKVKIIELDSWLGGIDEDK